MSGISLFILRGNDSIKEIAMTKIEVADCPRLQKLEIMAYGEMWRRPH